MYYEINVAKCIKRVGWNGQPEYTHFFATAERSLTNEENARFALAELRKAFPLPDYKIDVSRKCHTGELLNW